MSEKAKTKNFEESKSDTTETTDESLVESAKSENEENPMTKILGELGDHETFSYGPIHADILPVIIYDQGEFHFYSNRSSMMESGEYTMEHHEVVRASDHEAPTLDLSITNMVAFQWFAMIIVGLLFFAAAKRSKKAKNSAPRGIHNMLESIIVFVRDDIVKPNIPGNAADRLWPYFIILFLFILIMNLAGLLPGSHTPTGTLGVTAALSITAFLVINITAVRESGIGAWFKHLLGGAPWPLAPIMIPIEIASMFIKPFALTIRLFANMVAGHTVIFSLIGLLFVFQSIVIAPAIVGFATFINLLEILVAFLQAYIFVVLTAIFVGLAIGEHGEEH